MRQKALRYFQDTPINLHGRRYSELATLCGRIEPVMPECHVVAAGQPLSGSRRDPAVGSANTERVSEDKWSSDMTQDLAQDVMSGI